MAGFGLSNAVDGAINAYYMAKNDKEQEARRQLEQQNAELQNQQLKNQVDSETRYKQGLSSAYDQSVQTKPYKYDQFDQNDVIPGSDGLQSIAGVDKQKYLTGAEQSAMAAGLPEKADILNKMRQQDAQEGYKQAWQYAKAGMWDKANEVFNSMGDSRAKIDPHPGFPDGSVALVTTDKGDQSAIDLNKFGQAMGYTSNKITTLGEGQQAIDSSGKVVASNPKGDKYVFTDAGVLDQSSGKITPLTKEQQAAMAKKGSVGGSTSGNVQWAEWLTNNVFGGDHGAAANYIKSSSGNPIDNKTRLMQAILKHDSDNYIQRPLPEVLKEVDDTFSAMAGGRIVGGGVPAQGETPTTGVANISPPKVAIDALRSNPSLAPQFAAKYKVDPRQFIQQDNVSPSQPSPSSGGLTSMVDRIQREKQLNAQLSTPPNQEQISMGKKFGLPSTATKEQRGKDYNSMAMAYTNVIRDANSGKVPQLDDLQNALRFAQGKNDTATAKQITDIINRFYK